VIMGQPPENEKNQTNPEAKNEKSPSLQCL